MRLYWKGLGAGAISLLKTASASSFLNLIAALSGVVQVIWDPRYLALWVVGTGDPLANEIVLLESGCSKSSVLSIPPEAGIGAI